ncbi:MAG: TrkH family potassium uptake protein [Deltaproteobacteria bacterium]|nr:MAG: TrkH family potassium uptake protein [Deltaproteobacteria bacterium]
MLLPLGVSLIYAEGDAKAILISLSITTLSGLVLYGLTRGTVKEIGNKDGFVIVALGWISACLFGSLPYLFSGSLGGFTNCYFESASGFTTTGATIVNYIEELPHGILFWRSLTHWLGGMGIILLSLAILPFLGIGGMQLYRAEVPGPVMDKLAPRVRETAKTLWKVYVGISALEVVLLLLGGMGWFEALCHTFGTMATGGFSTRSASIGFYRSTYFEIIIIFFMLAAGTNFSLHYQFLKGEFSAFWRSAEFRFYIAVILTGITLITLNLRLGSHYDLSDSLRYASFQVSSIVTTTGYTTADFGSWPSLSQCLLLILMFVGGCAGSTGGSVKCLRNLLLLKQGYREIYRHIHPRAVVPIKLGGRVVPSEVMEGIWGFFLLYMFIFIVASIIMSVLGLDLISAIASVAASIGNVGPGLGSVGPSSNYADIPLIGKWVLTFCMLLGRLEIYTVIILLVPEFWRK